MLTDSVNWVCFFCVKYLSIVIGGVEKDFAGALYFWKWNLRLGGLLLFTVLRGVKLKFKTGVIACMTVSSMGMELEKGFVWESVVLEVVLTYVGKEIVGGNKSCTSSKL